MREQIRERSHDPEIAEKLIPKGYPFGVKRIPLDSGYFETFNRRTCTWSTSRTTRSRRSPRAGVQLADGTEYEVDAIVYATGFDAMTGPMNKIDIRGRGARCAISGPTDRTPTSG